MKFGRTDVFHERFARNTSIGPVVRIQLGWLDAERNGMFHSLKFLRFFDYESKYCFK